MSDDEGGRLLIDDCNDSGSAVESDSYRRNSRVSSFSNKTDHTEENVPSVPSILSSDSEQPTIKTIENVENVSNGNSLNGDIIKQADATEAKSWCDDSTKEEGELEDEDMEVSISVSEPRRKSDEVAAVPVPVDARRTSNAAAFISALSALDGDSPHTSSSTKDCPPKASSLSSNHSYENKSSSKGDNRNHSHSSSKNKSDHSHGGHISSNGSHSHSSKSHDARKRIHDDRSSDKKKNYVDEREREKRKAESPIRTSHHDVAKKSKPSTRDRGTCVQTRAVQSEREESIFDLPIGTTALVQLTVMCKMDTNQLYVVAKWKDDELTGILTDGEPPAFNTYMKKRKEANSGGGTAAQASGSDTSNSSIISNTPTKKATQPNIASGSAKDSAKKLSVSEKKKKATCLSKPGGSNDNDDDDIDVCGDTSRPPSGASGPALFEVPSKHQMHTCRINGCEYRFERGEELDYHKASMHATKAIITESICCQTEQNSVRSVATDVEGLRSELATTLTEDLDDNIQRLMKTATTSSHMDKKPKEEPYSRSARSPYSDLSDDGIAPELQKEEPTASTLTVSESRLPLQMSEQLAAAAAAAIAAAATSVSAADKDVVVIGSGTSGQPSSFHSVTPTASQQLGHVLSGGTLLAPTPTGAGNVQPGASPRGTSSIPSITGGGMFVPPGYPHSFMSQMGPFVPPPIAAAMTRPISSPVRPDHKIHELKKEVTEGSSSSAGGSITTPKPTPSPAQQQQNTPARQQQQFGSMNMMTPQGTNSPLHHQQQMFQQAQAQAAQQQQMMNNLNMNMNMQSMAAWMAAASRFPPGAGGPNPTQQEMAAAMMAMQHPFMYNPK